MIDLDRIEKATGTKVNRRKFIKLFGLSGLTALLSACGTSHFLNSDDDKATESSLVDTGASDGDGDGDGDGTASVTVYRLSSRKAGDTACKNHAYHYYFKDENSIVRAHDGCSCRVVTQSISQTTYDEIFSGVASGAAWVA